MTETSGASRWALGLGVVGAVLVLLLLVQNVLQARAITALQQDLVDLKMAVVEGRRTDQVAALGGLSSATTKATPRKKGKRSGKKAPQRGDRVVRDPLSEGAQPGKAGRRRAAGETDAAPDGAP